MVKFFSFQKQAVSNSLLRNAINSRITQVKTQKSPVLAEKTWNQLTSMYKNRLDVQKQAPTVKVFSNARDNASMLQKGGRTLLEKTANILTRDGKQVTPQFRKDLKRAASTPSQEKKLLRMGELLEEAAKATEENNKTTRNLGLAGIGTGVGSMVAGLATEVVAKKSIPADEGSVNDIISKFKNNNPRKKTIGIFSAPSLHEQLRKNLTLNAKEEKVGMIFISCIDLANLFLKSRKEILNEFITMVEVQME
jgi:hypothetical protein